MHTPSLAFESHPSARPDPATPRVLVVSYQSVQRRTLIRVAERAAAEVAAFAEPREALVWAARNRPDLVVADLELPDIPGDTFMRRCRRLPGCENSTLLALVDQGDAASARRAALAGAADVAGKPLDSNELENRIGLLLRLNRQERIIERQARWLEHGFANAVTENMAREKETLMRLARAGEYRDEFTGAHIMRIGRYSRLVAESLGQPAAWCDVIESAAPMHDIGKIGVPDALLLKNGPFSTRERELMQEHAIIGFNILKDSPSQYLQMGAEIALAHHEKFDGSGYPHKLRGKDIPLSARIVAVADVFDALVSVRPYKQAWPLERALEWLIDHSGSHFDPDCVDAFLGHVANGAIPADPASAAQPSRVAIAHVSAAIAPGSSAR
ncbi:MAG: HD domain-containing protein [Pseudomonadota bacterium]|nr:MAG: HD domain-containing protein [Pseudomonadota bacterium]